MVLIENTIQMGFLYSTYYLFLGVPWRTQPDLQILMNGFDYATCRSGMQKKKHPRCSPCWWPNPLSAPHSSISSQQYSETATETENKTEWVLCPSNNCFPPAHSSYTTGERHSPARTMYMYVGKDFWVCRRTRASAAHHSEVGHSAILSAGPVQ